MNQNSLSEREERGRKEKEINTKRIGRDLNRHVKVDGYIMCNEVLHGSITITQRGLLLTSLLLIWTDWL